MPSVVYVDDAWATKQTLDVIPNPDPLVVGEPDAIFGITAFKGVNKAQTVVSAGGTILVNAGTYNEAVNLKNNNTLRLLGTAPGAPGTIEFNSLTGSVGTTLDTSSYVGPLANTLNLKPTLSTTFSGSLTGSGIFQLDTTSTGTMILPFNNPLFTGTTRVNGGILQVNATNTSNPLGTSSIVLGGGELCLVPRRSKRQVWPVPTFETQVSMPPRISV